MIDLMRLHHKIGLTFSQHVIIRSIMRLSRPVVLAACPVACTTDVRMIFGGGYSFALVETEIININFLLWRLLFDWGFDLTCGH